MSAGIDARVDRGLLGAGEVALALVTVSVVGGFSRLFRDNSYFGKMAALAVVSHVLASIVRRLGRSIVWSGAISAIGLAVVGGVVFYADTTFAGLPTLATRDAAIADLRLAWNLFGTVRAPAPVEPGFVLAGAIAVWVVAFLADWAAFRVWSTLEALFPASIVFVFAALLGRGQYRLVATAIFGGAVLVFVLVHRLAKSEMTCSWLAHDPNDGRLALARIGLFGIATAVVLGLIVGPALPGAGEEAVLAWRDLDGGGARSGARVTVSPLVDIQARLVSQSSAEVFTVRSPSPEYWRLTALDRFDGVAWTSSGSYSRAGDNLATRLPPSVPTRTLEQTFTISKLAALWLPAAFEPAAVVDDGDSGARYEAESGTLTVKEGKETSDGLTYTIQSRIPQRDRAAVQAGTTALPTEFRLRYTDVPSRVSSYLRDFLNEASTRQLMGLGNGRLTNRSPYEQALLVQNFFRNNFAYDLEVAAGHSVNDIQSFVRARKGYCEQFAGTFAAMMRTLGVPARVAVGFTPGELQSDGLYHVRGEHAHAWPEVFLSGVGWVRFEPTPNRGAPGDEAYTGVAPAQEEGSLPESSPTPTTAPGDPTDPVDVPPDLDPSELDGLATSGGDPAEDNGAPSSIEGIQQILLVALIIALSTVLAVGIVPFLKFVQRRRRRSRAVGQPRQEIGVSWAETVDALGLLDLDATAAQTPSEVAQRSAPTLGDAAPDLERLAELTTRATFDAGEPAADEVAAASSAARSVRASVTRRVTRRRRAMRALDPRPLLPRAQLRG